MSATLTATLSLLITANHVLDYYNLADAFGHVSVRSPTDPTTFYMTGNAVPAFVRNTSDLAHYYVNDSSPVNPNDGTSSDSPYSERFCHAGVLARYPQVQAVVHSHSVPVITVGTSSVAMEAMFHMAGFLGTSVPVFDIANYYNGSAAQNMLVNSNQLGAYLAYAFSTPAHNKTKTSTIPDYAAVLQRGHGFTTWGGSIEEAVYRAVYTQENAQIQMGAATFVAASTTEGGIVPLTKQEAADSAVLNHGAFTKGWEYWSQLVEANPLYQNALQ